MPKKKKIFVLDTSVILHDYNALLSFKEKANVLIHQRAREKENRMKAVLVHLSPVMRNKETMLSKSGAFRDLFDST